MNSVPANTTFNFSTILQFLIILLLSFAFFPYVICFLHDGKEEWKNCQKEKNHFLLPVRHCKIAEKLKVFAGNEFIQRLQPQNTCLSCYHNVITHSAYLVLGNDPELVWIRMPVDRVFSFSMFFFSFNPEEIKQ